MSGGDEEVGPGELDAAAASPFLLHEDLGGLASEGVGPGVVDAVPEPARDLPEVEAGEGLVAGEAAEGLGVVVAPAEGTEVVARGLTWRSAVVEGDVRLGVVEVGRGVGGLGAVGEDLE